MQTLIVFSMILYLFLYACLFNVEKYIFNTFTACLFTEILSNRAGFKFLQWKLWVIQLEIIVLRCNNLKIEFSVNCYVWWNWISIKSILVPQQFLYTRIDSLTTMPNWIDLQNTRRISSIVIVSFHLSYKINFTDASMLNGHCNQKMNVRLLKYVRFGFENFAIG